MLGGPPNARCFAGVADQADCAGTRTPRSRAFGATPVTLSHRRARAPRPWSRAAPIPSELRLRAGGGVPLPCEAAAEFGVARIDRVVDDGNATALSFNFPLRCCRTDRSNYFPDHGPSAITIMPAVTALWQRLRPSSGWGRRRRSLDDGSSARRIASNLSDGRGASRASDRRCTGRDWQWPFPSRPPFSGVVFVRRPHERLELRSVRVVARWEPGASNSSWMCSPQNTGRRRLAAVRDQYSTVFGSISSTSA